MTELWGLQPTAQPEGVALEWGRGLGLDCDERKEQRGPPMDGGEESLGRRPWRWRLSILILAYAETLSTGAGEMPRRQRKKDAGWVDGWIFNIGWHWDQCFFRCMRMCDVCPNAINCLVLKNGGQNCHPFY